MIRRAKDRLVDAGGVPVSSYNDTTGVWGYNVRIAEDSFILVAKQFDYKDNASFLLEAVDRAVANDHWLLFYNGSGSTYTVFDPENVSQNGTPSEGWSRTRNAQWLEIPMDEGVGLSEFVQRNERPKSVDDTSGVGLDRWTDL